MNLFEIARSSTNFKLEGSNSWNLVTKDIGSNSGGMVRLPQALGMGLGRRLNMVLDLRTVEYSLECKFINLTSNLRFFLDLIPVNF
jgi:hypothetical protein